MAFHDAANSIATIVSTKGSYSLSGSIWAAFFNFVAFFIAKYLIGGFGIANHCVQDCDGTVYYTADYIIRSDCCHSMESVYLVERYSLHLLPIPLLADLQEPPLWPHGFDAIQLNIILKIAAFIFLAPLIGMIVAFGFTLLVLFYACRRAHPPYS